MIIRQLEPGTAETHDQWRFIPLPSESEGQGLPPEEPWATVDQISAELPTVVIESLFDDRLLLRVPVTLELEQEGNFYIAKCDEFEEFGYGGNPFQAVDDFRQTLAELYWTLKEEQSRLAPGLAGVWQRLNQVVQVVRAP